MFRELKFGWFFRAPKKGQTGKNSDFPLHFPSINAWAKEEERGEGHLSNRIWLTWQIGRSYTKGKAVGADGPFGEQLFLQAG
jgi:hypothetical protein